MFTTFTIELPEGVDPDMFNNIIRPVATALVGALKDQLESLNAQVTLANQRADRTAMDLDAAERTVASLKSEKTYTEAELLRLMGENETKTATIEKVQTEADQWASRAGKAEGEAKRLLEYNTQKQQRLDQVAQKVHDVTQQLLDIRTLLG